MPRPPERSTGGGSADHSASSFSVWRSRSSTAVAAVESTSDGSHCTVRGSGSSKSINASGRSPRSAKPTCAGNSTVPASIRRSSRRASKRCTGVRARASGTASAASRLVPTGGPAASACNTRSSSAANSAKTASRSTPTRSAAGRPKPPGYGPITWRVAGATASASSLPHTSARLRKLSRAGWSRRAATSRPSSCATSSRLTAMTSAPAITTADSTAKVNLSRSSQARATDAAIPARVASTVESAGTGTARSGRARSNATSVSSSRESSQSASVVLGIWSRVATALRPLRDTPETALSRSGHV